MEPQEIGGRSFTLRMIADYCKECIEWSEAKPIVEMLNALMLGSCSPEEAQIIKDIKREFRDRNHGNVFNGPVGQVLERVDKVETSNYKSYGKREEE